MEPGGFASGETVESDPPHRLVETMEAHWSTEVEREGETRITWEILPRSEFVGLRITHGELSDEASDEIYGGWPFILSSLKSPLETGKPLNLQVPPKRSSSGRRRRGRPS